MINVTFSHFEDGSPKGFIVKGHSGLGEQGNDILCASVSSAAYLTANTVTEIMGIKAEAKVKDGYMKFTIPPESKDKARDILLGFKLHISELAEQYPSNVKLITEV